MEYLLIFSCHGSSQMAVSASLWLSMWQRKYCNRDKWCQTVYTECFALLFRKISVTFRTFENGVFNLPLCFTLYFCLPPFLLFQPWKNMFIEKFTLNKYCLKSLDVDILKIRWDVGHTYKHHQRNIANREVWPKWP